MIGLIIAAGGKSSRMGENKLKLPCMEGPLLETTIRKFLPFSEIEKIVVVTDELDVVRSIEDVRVCTAPPGKSRALSVMNGLTFFEENDFVLIHDGARPFIDECVIEKCLEKAKKQKAFFVGVSMIDSIKRKVGTNFFSVDRDDYFIIQTPQGGVCKDLIEAHAFCEKRHLHVTDDASALEKIGVSCSMVEGNRENIKITYPSDKRYLP